MQLASRRAVRPIRSGSRQHAAGGVVRCCRSAIGAPAPVALCRRWRAATRAVGDSGGDASSDSDAAAAVGVSAAEAPAAAAAATAAAYEEQRRRQQQQRQARLPPLDVATARHLASQLRQLSPPAPAISPATPAVAALLPLARAQLGWLPAPALVAALRVCAASGAAPDAAWLGALAASVRRQLPGLRGEAACELLSELVQLRRAAGGGARSPMVMPPGLLDDLCVAAARGAPEADSARALAAALAAVALAELDGGLAASGDAGGAMMAACGLQGTEGPPAADEAAAAAAPSATAASQQDGGSSSSNSSSSTVMDAAVADAAAAEAERPGSFAAALAAGGSGGSGAGAAGSVGVLSSYEEFAAATVAADDDGSNGAPPSSPDAIAAVAASANARRRAHAAEAAAAGASAAAAARAKAHNGAPAAGAAAAGARIETAGWLAGFGAGDDASAGVPLSEECALVPVLAAALVEALGPQRGRLAELAPHELAAVVVAVAALRARPPAGWLDGLFAALELRLEQLPPAALAGLAAALPLLLPPGAHPRLWRRLGAAVEARGARLSPEQLCEALPVLAAGDVALPRAWLQDVALERVRGALPWLLLPQASRALVASVALGAAPSRAWADAYLARLRGGLSEVNAEGLVDALRALAEADLLPSRAWLVEVEEEALRRFGLLGPQEVAATGFLFANLSHGFGSHLPSLEWRRRWRSEALRFADYYAGGDLSRVVWSAQRLRCEVDSAWLRVFAARFSAELGAMRPWELSFTLGALQALSAPLPARLCDEALAAFAVRVAQCPAATGAPPAAQPADVALMLATLARLRHVPSYAPLQRVLDDAQARLAAYDGAELVTLLWALAQLHHQPDDDFLAAFDAASGALLPALSGPQLAQLLWACAQLGHEPGGGWMDAFLEQTQAALLADGMGARDAASLLSALAALQHTPSEAWLHSCLQLCYWRARELDADGLASLLASLARLNVVVAEGQWLDAMVSLALPRLASMSADSAVGLLSALAAWRARPPRAWAAAFQLAMVRRADDGAASPAHLEQVLVALTALGQAPSSALLSAYFDASAPTLARASPASVSAVLAALQRAGQTPEPAWLEAAVAGVRDNIASYSLGQLACITSALTAFQEAGGLNASAAPSLPGFLSYLREFF